MFILPVTENTPIDLPSEVLIGHIEGVPVLVLPEQWGYILVRLQNHGEHLEQTFVRIITTPH